MNRNQRRYGRSPKKIGNASDASDHLLNIVEVLPPKERRFDARAEKKTNDRASYAYPVQIDESLLTDNLTSDQSANVFFVQRDLDSATPDSLRQIDQLQNVLTRITQRKEKSSQYLYHQDPSVVIPDGFHWQNIKNSEALDKYLGAMKQTTSIKNVHISDVPRIKVIVEKFSKFKKDNIELRKLEEKIVCVEYDVYGENESETSVPMQKMRAYFSVKPVADNKDSVLILPSIIKRKFDISDDDMKKLNEKEIEIIDGTVSENKSYLEDLKRVLKLERAIYAKKNKSTLDLQSLYKMAKRNCACLDEDFSNTNLLSKAELEEIKHLITKKCDSSVHGISRKTIKADNNSKEQGRNINNISDLIYAELTRSQQNH